jgi:Fe-S-cluster containining protein
MPLSNSDIVRIRKLGFSEDFFVVKRNRERKLKNSMGRCVFHDGRLCTIYDHRPEGCRIYPVLYDTYTGKVVLDVECPHPEDFQVTPDISCEIIKLVGKLDAERNDRLGSKRG